MRSCLRVAAASLILLATVQVTGVHPAGRWVADAKKPRGLVKAVYFFAKDCSLCRNVDELIEALKVTYPFSVLKLDIGATRNYDLFRRLEDLHADAGFAVPMVLVGERILVGEEEIVSRLEGEVQRLSQSGGSRLPYLGPRFSQ